MVTASPWYQYLERMRLIGLGRIASSGEALGGGALGLLALDVGSQYGTVELADVVVGVLGNDQRATAIVSPTLLRVEQYLCRVTSGSDQGYQMRAPAITDLPALGTQRPCGAGEWFGYYGEAGVMTFRPELGYVGARILELGLLANVFSTGRTERAHSELWIFRIGGSVDATDAGAIATSGAPRTNGFLRASVGTRLALSTRDRIVRLVASADWRPNLLEWADQVFEADLRIQFHYVPDRAVVMALFAWLGWSFATRPWTRVSSWADPAATSSLMMGMGVEVFWHGN